MHGASEEPRSDGDEFSEDWEMTGADRYRSLLEGEVPEEGFPFPDEFPEESGSEFEAGESLRDANGETVQDDQSEVEHTNLIPGIGAGSG